jgi:hypothetical protein
MHRGNNKCIAIIVRKREGKRPLERCRNRCKDNIKINLMVRCIFKTDWCGNSSETLL